MVQAATIVIVVPVAQPKQSLEGAVMRLRPAPHGGSDRGLTGAIRHKSSFADIT